MTVRLPQIFSMRVALVGGDMPREIYQWLHDNVGGVIDTSFPLLNVIGDGWYAWADRSIHDTHANVMFKFDDTSKAVMFKLMFA